MKKKRREGGLTPGTPAPEKPAASLATPPVAKGAPVDLARALAAARAAEARDAGVAAMAADPTASTRSPAVAATAAGGDAGTTSRTMRERARARDGQAVILLFRVGAERFGIELAAVEEAIDIPPVHYVPEMPAAMLGVITVRDTITSVYSPSVALGLSLHDGTSALIFRRGASRVAVVVDEVDDVSTLDLALLRDAPAVEAADGIVLGVVRQRDSLLVLVDADGLLAACQAVPVLETA